MMKGLVLAGILVFALGCASAAPAGSGAGQPGQSAGLEEVITSIRRVSGDEGCPAALPLYEQALSRFPDSAILHRDYGWCLDRLERYADAAQAYRTALSIEPDNDQVTVPAGRFFYSYAWVLFRSGELETATRTISLATSVWPHYNTFLRSSQIHREYADLDQSVRDLRMAAESLMQMEELSDDGPEWYVWESSRVLAELRAAGRAEDWEPVAQAGIPAVDDDEFRTLVIGYLLSRNAWARARSLAEEIAAEVRRGLWAALLDVFSQEGQGAARLTELLSESRAWEDYQFVSDQLYQHTTQVLGIRDVHDHPLNHLAMDFQTQGIARYLEAHPPEYTTDFVPPLRGRFRASSNRLLDNQPFHGGMTRHYAYDLTYADGRENMGSAVYPVAPGTVVYVSDSNPDNPPGVLYLPEARNNVIVIEHPGGMRSNYSHLQQGSAQVRVGDSVTVWTRLAGMGNSGFTGGTHLHFHLEDQRQVQVPIPFSFLYRRSFDAGEDAEFTPIVYIDRTDYIYDARVPPE